MKRILLLMGINLIVLTNIVSAHTWRINTDPTKSPDFTTINDAIAAAAAGDTLLVEPSATAYPSFLLNKRLVILGNGYFLSTNTGLQANKDSSDVLSMTLDSSSITANASGSFIAGLTVNGTANVLHNVRNVTITRCHFLGQLGITAYTQPVSGIVYSQNFIEAGIVDAFCTAQVNITLENNIFSAANGAGFLGPNLDNFITGLFRNNTFNTAGPAITLNNFYFSNNVFTNTAMTAINGSNNIIHNNTFAAATVTGVTDGTDNNHTNADMTGVFSGSITAGYGDSRFQTQTSSPLRGTGETISGITPDRGAYNTVTTTDSYRNSGIPPIPAIYTLTVPASVPINATTIQITLSTRSNN